MDLNLVVISGRVAAEPEHSRFESGSSIRLLVTVRSYTPARRIDLVPIVVRNPSDDLTDGRLVPGVRVWATGTVQRRFWDSAVTGDKRSRLEILAHKVEVGDPEKDLVTM